MKRLAGPLLRGFELGIRVHPTPEAVTGEVAGLGEVGEALHGSPLFTPPRRRKGADYDAVKEAMTGCWGLLGKRRRIDELSPELLLAQPNDVRVTENGHPDPPPVSDLRTAGLVAQAVRRLRKAASRKIPSVKLARNLFSGKESEKEAVAPAPNIKLSAAERRSKLSDAQRSLRALRNVKPTVLKSALTTLDNATLVGLLHGLDVLLEPVAATAIQGRFRGNIARRSSTVERAKGKVKSAQAAAFAARAEVKQRCIVFGRLRRSALATRRRLLTTSSLAATPLLERRRTADGPCRIVRREPEHGPESGDARLLATSWLLAPRHLLHVARQ